MIPTPARPPVALRWLLALAFMLSAATACARQGADSMEASQVFTDPRTAELASAAQAGDAAQVRALAQAGVDVDARGDKGVNLLQWALLNQSVAGMTALLEAGADPSVADNEGATVVHYAALADDPAYLDALLAHGANPDTRNRITGDTPLVAALQGERWTQFEALLAAGADPNAANRVGDTPLHQAALINEPQRVLELLEAGADPRASNAQGVSFQRYLFKTDDRLLNETTRRQREAVREWLRAHDVPVEDAVTP